MKFDVIIMKDKWNYRNAQPMICIGEVRAGDGSRSHLHRHGVAPGLEWTSRKSKNELVEKYWGQWNEDYLRNTWAAEPSQPSRSPCTSHPISTHKEMTPKTFVLGWNLENWSQGNRTLPALVEFVTGFFHSAYFQGLSMLRHTLVLHSFILLNNTPLYGYCRFCLFVHLMKDVWDVYAFCLLWMMMLWTFVSKFLHTCFHFSHSHLSYIYI